MTVVSSSHCINTVQLLLGAEKLYTDNHEGHFPVRWNIHERVLPRPHPRFFLSDHERLGYHLTPCRTDVTEEVASCLLGVDAVGYVHGVHMF